MIIPCHRGGHHCSWPACPLDCDGREHVESYAGWSTDHLCDESVRLYDDYLEGEDNLTELAEIAEELGKRKDPNWLESFVKKEPK